MKQFFLILIILSSPLGLLAQSKPLYIADTSVSPFNTVPMTGVVPFDGYDNIVQLIYYHCDFPGMPIQGQITDVYIRMGCITPKGASLNGLSIKMKPTGVSSFSYNIYGANNIIETGLTTVFYDSTYVLKDSLAYGDWLRLPLKVPYTYSFVSGGDSSRNLMVEFSQDSSRHPIGKFEIFAYGNNGGFNKWLEAIRVSNNLSWVTPSPLSMLIGFNPKPDPPLGIQATEVKRVTIFPNPASRLIYLSHSGNYTISTLQGAIVQQCEGDVANIASLSQGLYIVQLTTKNGERLVGRFLKE